MQRFDRKTTRPPAGMLRRLVHRVDRLRLGERTALRDGELTVSGDWAAQHVTDPALAEVRVSCLSPGDRARIVKVLDSVEPRSKGPGGGGVFPGILGAPVPQGRGDTHVLRGVAVVAAGHLPRAQEALVDMSGPAAGLSPLSTTHNVVVEFKPAEGAAWEDVEAALRRGLLRLAAALADAGAAEAPDEVEELSPPRSEALSPDLPRVATITNLQCQGAFKDVLVYGRSFSGGLPALVDALELEDGAVVSAQYGHPALKNPTYLFLNHPIVAALRERDGRDLHFAGLILSPEPVEQARKEQIAAHAARLCRSLALDAVIVTKEGGGNADGDVSLKMDALEDAGITAVGLLAEMSGADGTGPPLVTPPERGGALVSTGNYDERIHLDAVERALGGDRFDVAGVEATAAMEVPAAVIYASLSPLGWGRLSAGETGS